MDRLFMALAVGAVSLITGMMPASGDGVFIQNDRQYIGDDGSFHIVGEIQNSLEIPINQISVTATLLDDAGTTARMQTDSLVNTIMPGMRGPFDLVLTDRVKAGQVVSYLLDLDYHLTAPKSQAIDIAKSALSTDNFNNLMITGTITNRGDITANTVAVIATLYDKDGNVAAVSLTHPEPDYLGAGDDAFFLVSMPEKIQAGTVADYALIAESEEYAAVPEFPVGTAIMLVGTLSAYVGITRFSGRIIANLVFATNPK